MNKAVSFTYDALIRLCKYFATSEDSLGEEEETNKDEHFQKVAHSDYNDHSDVDSNVDSDSDTGGSHGSDGDVLFDSEDDGGDDDTVFDSEDNGGDVDNEDMDEHPQHEGTPWPPSCVKVTCA